MSVLEVYGKNPSNPLCIDVCGRELLTESERRQQSKLRASIQSIHIRSRIRLGITEPLGLSKHSFESGIALFNLGQDEIACSVENAIERRHSITRDSLAQHRVNGNAAGNA